MIRSPTFLIIPLMICISWSFPFRVGAETIPSSQKNIVTTIHPLTAILQEIVTDRLTIKTLLAPASSPHTFEPKPSDIRAVEQAAALFYVGSHLDEEWVFKVPAARKIMMLGLLSEDLLLALHENHQTDKDVQTGHHEHGHGVVDPHFWTDPLAVKALLPQLLETLIDIDPEGRKQYTTNMYRFAESLDRLHEKTAQILMPLKKKPILLLHPSFQYLIKRYELYFVGVIEFSPGKEPTPRFILETVNTIKKLKVKTLFSETQLSKKSVSAIAEAVGIPVTELDPIGGVSGRRQYQELILYNANAFAAGLQ